MAEWVELTEVERDALREVANIGAGHAATALSQMTDRVIMISVPEVTVRRLDQVAELVGPADTVVVAVSMRLLGDLTGQAMVILPLGAARTLCDLLLGRNRGDTGSFGPMEESSIKETGNILTSAYLTALSEFLGMMLIPSIPSMATEYAGALLTSAHLSADPDRDVVFCVDTAFRVEGAPEVLNGEFLLLPDSASLTAIFEAIRLG